MEKEKEKQYDEEKENGKRKEKQYGEEKERE